MKRGFIALQKLYRKKLHSRETDLWRQLKVSEREFQIKLNILKEKRKTQEKIYENLKHTPSGQFQNAFFNRNNEKSVDEVDLKIQDYWKERKRSLEIEPSNDIIKENAVIVIQVAVRYGGFNLPLKNIYRTP